MQTLSNTHKYGAIILCGGKSSRFNFIDKGSIDFKNTPLFIYPLRAVAPVVTEIIISVSEKNQHFYQQYLSAHKKEIPEYTIVVDVCPDYGPLGGMFSAFKFAKSEKIFVCACDMPFISQDLVKYLFEIAGEYDVTVPYINKNYEPLHAVYRRETTLKAIRKLINKKIYKIIEFYPELKVQKVPEKQLKKFDKKLRSFYNINTMEEYMRHFA